MICKFSKYLSKEPVACPRGYNRAWVQRVFSGTPAHIHPSQTNPWTPFSFPPSNSSYPSLDELLLNTHCDHILHYLHFSSAVMDSHCFPNLQLAGLRAPCAVQTISPCLLQYSPNWWGFLGHLQPRWAARSPDNAPAAGKHCKRVIHALAQSHPPDWPY